MNTKLISQIILGAGRPYRGEESSSLKKISENTRVLDWTLQAVKYLNPEVHFVAGYQIEEIVSKFPNLLYTVNPEWKSTGPVFSLLQARPEPSSDCIVSYGDILFRQDVVQKLIDLDSEVGIAVDSMWKDRYQNRTQDDLNKSEKVIINGIDLESAHKEISKESANAEFIGLLLLKPAVMKFIQTNRDHIFKKMRKDTLIQLIEFLKKNGFEVKAVDVSGDWAELNESNDLVNFILGTKAQSLERLEGVLSLSRIAPQVNFTVEEWNTQSEIIINQIQDKFQDKKLIIRSSAISEDGFESSNAGAYASLLNIYSGERRSLNDAINNVISSYIDSNSSNQVLVQPMIQDVIGSGVIFTKTLTEAAPYYVINFDDSSSETDSITSGSSQNHKTFIVLKDNNDHYEASLPQNLYSLLQAVKEIENLLNFNSLDIEFAITRDGDIHILQVRPLVDKKFEIDADRGILEAINDAEVLFKRLQNSNPFTVGGKAIFGVMPDWNPAEIIGTRPNRLSFDLYQYLITDKVWATQRAEYGYRDVRPHPLLVSFAGIPYVDVRASFNSFIPNSLDDDLASRLVDYYLNRLTDNPQYHDKVEFEIVPTCFSLNFDIWRKRLNQGGFSDIEINALSDALKEITKGGIARTTDDLQAIESFKLRYEEIYNSNLPVIDKALSLLEDCRQYGTLVFSHLARSAFISVTLLKSAVETKIISQKAMDSFMNSIETVAHDFINDARKVANFEVDWEEFIDTYGHLRPGTYDITSEAYSENVEKYLRPIVERFEGDKNEYNAEDNSWLIERESFYNALYDMGIDEDPNIIESFLRQSIEGREYAKFVFSKNLSAALSLFAEYGHSIDIDKKILAHLSLNSFFELRAGIISQKEASEFLNKEAEINQKLHNITNKIELPPLISEEKDFHVFMYPSTQPNYVGSTKITAKVISLNPEVHNVSDFELDGKILLIPQADPGFDWIFGHNIAGLITMYGGGNSHMAIRAKEFNLPAVIGIGEALYQSLKSASVIELDATNRKIEIVG